MLLGRQLLIVLLLTTLLPIYATGSTAEPDSVLVPSQLLREATRRIDATDLQVLTLKNRVTERDSTIASERRYWRGVVNEWVSIADTYRNEANSWWRQNRSAFWAVLGMVCAALALR